MKENESALISVLLPNYNNGPYLKEALDSVFNQSFQNFVIYLVDDCSTDNGLEIAKSYHDERLKIIEKDTNSGIVDTLNIGLAKINTKYFVRMDGDDISAPNRFECLVDFMERNPDVGVCGSNVQTFGLRNDLQTYAVDNNSIKSKLIFGHGICHATAIFRTEILKAAGIVYLNDFYRLEDYWLFYRLKDYTNSANVEDVLYHYRQEAFNNDPTILQRVKEEYSKIYNVILTELFGELEPNDIDLHSSLALKKEANHKFKVYQAYAKKLMKANSFRKIYPETTFNKEVEQRLDRLRFILIDTGVMGFWDIIFGSTNNKIGLLKYFNGTRKNR